MGLKPDWASKRDPEHHPVRFLAGLWQERMASSFGVVGMQLTPKELGQLKSLRKALGDFTRDVIEWVLDPVHWWRFSQQVRAEAKLHGAPPHPHVGFLLAHHGRALSIMRWELRDSTAAADISFCTKLDRLRYEQWKALLLVYADGIPAQVTKAATAKTLPDIQRAFIEIVDESIAASQQQPSH
jgi:hypothetical protein